MKPITTKIADEVRGNVLDDRDDPEPAMVVASRE
jgi:hypothetical protein